MPSKQKSLLLKQTPNNNKIVYVKQSLNEKSWYGENSEKKAWSVQS